MGRSVFEVLRDNPARLERIERAMRGEEFTSEVQVADQFVDVHYKPARDGAGVVTGVTSIAFDITERVRAQRERQELEIAGVGRHPAPGLHRRPDRPGQPAQPLRTP